MPLRPSDARHVPSERVLDTGPVTKPALAAHTLVANVAIVFFAIWTLVEQASFFAGLNFEQSWILGWALSIGGAGFVVRAACTRGRPLRQPVRLQTGGKTWMLPASIVAVVVTLCLHRPDADDSCYLGIAALALDYTSIPMSTLLEWTRCPAGYALTSFEFLRASTSWLTGMPLLVSYYLLWPALIAIVVVAVNCDLMNMAGVRNLALAWLILLVVLLAWGDVHRTPSNFGLVRLFQGKSALFWAVVPAAICNWLRVVQQPDRRSLLMLFCTIVAGVGLSPTGVPMGAFLLGLFFAATCVHGAPRSPDRRVLLGLLAIAAYPIAMGLIIRYGFDHQAYGVTTDAGIRETVSNTDMIVFVLGSNLRGVVALLCAIALPFLLAPSGNRRLLSAYSVLCSILLVCPWTSTMLGTLGYGSFAWRWIFSIPFALAIIVAVDALAHHIRTPDIRHYVTGMLLVIYVAASQRFVASAGNHAEWRRPGFKTANKESIFLRPYHGEVEIRGHRLISPESGRGL